MRPVLSGSRTCRSRGEGSAGIWGPAGSFGGIPALLWADRCRTPAMRLGFAKQPLEFEDLVWPGERVPQPKRARRRERKAIAA